MTPGISSASSRTERAAIAVASSAMRSVVVAIAVPVLAVTAACGGSAPPREPPAPTGPTTRTEPATWRVPDGWKSETIPFPLGFAPTLAHTGAEELRFAPSVFDHTAPGYWSYAFVWRLADPAALDAATLAGELTAYYRGLVDAVDAQDRVTGLDEIRAVAVADGAGFRIDVHLFDVFDKTAYGAPLDLSGTAARIACGDGALWRFVLAPAGSTLRAELDALVAEATCAQSPPPATKD
jgi:hypothetical protein